jgi:hypothetical protein
MDAAIADKIVEFIFAATGSGRSSIICNPDGVIIAAHVKSRVGNVHAGAQRMLREGLPDYMVTAVQEEESGGAMKAGCNLPLVYNGELIGSIGIAGDPEKSEPVTRMAAGLIAKELREREVLDQLINHAAEMDRAITEIRITVEGADASQLRVSAKVEEVEHLIEASIEDISRTDEVIDTIQSISSNTQMLGLNASIEAAHAREHGRGFSIVAEAVRKLSVQCGDSAESVKATQGHLHDSMSRVVDCSRDLMAATQEQTKATSDIARMVAELKRVSEALVALARI